MDRSEQEKNIHITRTSSHCILHLDDSRRVSVAFERGSRAGGLTRAKEILVQETLNNLIAKGFS